MSEPREIVPILFLGSDPRFVNPDVVPPEQVKQIAEARGRDFRPYVRPADAPEVAEDEVPKDSSATEPASDSNDGETSRSSEENPGGSVDAEKDQKPDEEPPQLP